MLEASSTRGTYHVESVGKALEILCSFSGYPQKLSLTQISCGLGLPKSTAHNLLRTLQSLDFLVQDEDSKLFSLGPRIFELGLNVWHVVELQSRARPHMQHLRELTKETVRLGVLCDGKVLIIGVEESLLEQHKVPGLGFLLPLHATSMGKAILADLDDLTTRYIIAKHGLASVASSTITSLEQLERELATIRRIGFALDSEESEEGVRCAAAAILGSNGRVMATISVSGPVARISPHRMQALGLRVKQKADAITLSLSRERP